VLDASAYQPVRFPWLAAVHALGRDAANPHVHIILVDEDVSTREGGEPHTGRTAVGFSDMGSTERLRHAWAECISEVFGATGSTVSARSYKRLAEDARRAGDDELASYYEACDAMKALHIGPAAAAAVRARREVRAEHLRTSAERYRQSYFGSQPDRPSPAAPPAPAGPAASKVRREPARDLQAIAAAPAPPVEKEITRPAPAPAPATAQVPAASGDASARSVEQAIPPREPGELPLPYFQRLQRLGFDTSEMRARHFAPRPSPAAETAEQRHARLTRQAKERRDRSDDEYDIAKRLRGA
jgi:hypothetical protein